MHAFGCSEAVPPKRSVNGSSGHEDAIELLDLNFRFGSTPALRSVRTNDKKRSFADAEEFSVSSIRSTRSGSPGSLLFEGVPDASLSYIRSGVSL